MVCKVLGYVLVFVCGVFQFNFGVNLDDVGVLFGLVVVEKGGDG